MERLYGKECDPGQLSPLALAFAGDAVFELFVRERLVCMGNRPVNKLHRLSVEQVCASAQSGFVEKLMPVLTDEEKEILRRGRNAHTNHVPKNAEVAQYHAATAFEALFGNLYLSGNMERLRSLFNLICGEN